MAEALEGGCLCGTVRFRAIESPMRTLACHCTFCQKVTGSSYFAESMFAMDAVTFNDGKLKSYEHVSDGSNKKVFVHFCPNCGTTVSLTFERWPDVRGIARGCYDNPDAVTVSSHIWTRSAQSETALPEESTNDPGWEGRAISHARLSSHGESERCLTPRSS
ncbi:MAG: GFA family protein [Rubrivivax sp.]|nr:GFA family protein [Rubrivivax sp.]